MPDTQGAQAWITQFHLQITPWLPLIIIIIITRQFVRCRNMALVTTRAPNNVRYFVAFTRWRLTRLRLWTSNCSVLLIYLPQKHERLSLPSWLTYCGWFTHISGHSSAVGRAEDRESLPVKAQRPAFYNCAMQPTNSCHDI